MRVLAFFMVVGLSACSVSTSDEGATPGGDEEKPVLDPRILVESVEAVVGAVGDNVVASASVESEGQAVLIPEASGLVTGVYAEEGDRVVRGQLLAEIASPALDGAYARAAEELARAEGDAASAERLFAQGALSRSELEAAQRAHTAARTVHAEARQTRGFTRLESPINGVVASRQIRYGETAGPTPAFTVVDLDRLRVVVALPERDLARVRPGQPATIVSAYDDAVAGSGQVLRVAPVVDTATGTVRVTVGLDPGQVQLRPGQFVNVQIEVARHESVVTVPRLLAAIAWALEPVGSLLMRLFRPLVIDSVGADPRGLLRPLDPAERALLGALLPFGVGLLWLRRAVRWRLAVLRSDLGVTGATQAARAPESGSAIARRWLAAQGIASGPDRPAPPRPPEADFAEAEAAARALLASLKASPGRTPPGG